jgi:transcriptional antiterminator RfaH
MALACGVRRRKGAAVMRWPEDCWVWPDDLFTRLPVWRDGSACWWACQTKARAETAFVQRLRSNGVAYFLPVYSRPWQSTGRRRTACLPLFPGCVFVYGDESARAQALRTNLVSRLLPVPDQQGLSGDLGLVHRLMRAGATLTPADHLGQGRPVEITHGSLAEVQGRVLSEGQRLRFVVEVRCLQQGVSMRVEGWMIRPVP